MPLTEIDEALVKEVASNHPKLGSLSLRDNKLVEVGPWLKELRHLVKLDLSNNMLHSLVGLVLPKLAELRVGGNLLCTLEGIEGAPSLEYVDVSNNSLITFDECKNLHHLRHLKATGNPTQATPEDIQALVPSLRQVDLDPAPHPATPTISVSAVLNELGLQDDTLSFPHTPRDDVSSLDTTYQEDRDREAEARGEDEVPVVLPPMPRETSRQIGTQAEVDVLSQMVQATPATLSQSCDPHPIPLSTASVNTDPIPKVQVAAAGTQTDSQPDPVTLSIIKDCREEIEASAAKVADVERKLQLAREHVALLQQELSALKAEHSTLSCTNQLIKSELSAAEQSISEHSKRHLTDQATISAQQQSIHDLQVEKKALLSALAVSTRCDDPTAALLISDTLLGMP